MRTLEGHKVHPTNDLVTVTVVKDAHEYALSGPNFTTLHVRFQDGPINEAGVNGVTSEALISVLIDRLEIFQSGQFANHHNQAALDHLKAAQTALLERTQERMRRGVEGTNQV